MDMGHYEEAYELWRRTDGISITEADTRDGIARYLARNPGMCFVALDGGCVVGTILGGHDGRRGYITHLAVDAQYRRQADRRKPLVDRCVEALKGEGMIGVNLFVLAHNKEGREFWESRGWAWPDDWGVMNRKLEA